jgi:hypothetical protein
VTVHRRRCKNTAGLGSYVLLTSLVAIATIVGEGAIVKFWYLMFALNRYGLFAIWSELVVGKNQELRHFVPEV